MLDNQETLRIIMKKGDNLPMAAKQMRSLIISAFLVTNTVFFTGCVQKGPAQRAGENIDRAVEDMKDAVDPPGPAQKAGRSLDRAIDNVTK